MSEKTRELARRWFEEVWNERRDETIDEMLHPDCIGHHEGHVTRGPADFKAMRGGLIQVVPDIALHVEEILADETNAAVRWRFTGTTAGPSAKPVEFEGITWLKFKDDKITEGWDRWNQAAFTQMVSR
jgi:predicted ester cyclase